MEERQASRQHRVILTNRGTCALNGISDILSFDVNEILLETEMSGEGASYQAETLMQRKTYDLSWITKINTAACLWSGKCAE